MKTLNFFAVLLLVLTGITFFGCKKESKDVCAKWGDQWWSAKIVSQSNGTYHVLYSDNTTGDLSESDIKYPLKKEDVKVDQRVLALWTNGRYYEGTVSELKQDGAIIKWDDGSTPLLVKFGSICEGFPMQQKDLTYETSTGRKVCALWSNSWYDAKVMSEGNGKIHVIFYDNVQSDNTPDQVKELIKGQSDLKINDKVYAIWTSDKFYSGVITDIQATGATVKWDDGSTPTLVEFGKIAKQ